MNVRGVLTLAACLLFTLSAKGSFAVSTWNQALNFGASDSAAVNCAIAADSAGNVYTTGLINARVFATVKYSRTGQQMWRSDYVSPDTAEGRAVTVDSAGNVYATGYFYVFNMVNHLMLRDYATIKYDSNGAQQWVAMYSGPTGDNNTPNAIAVDSSGNVYVTGVSPGNGTGNDIATIKYNSSGVQQWVSRYDAGSDEAGNGLALDASNNVYIAGQTSGTSGGVILKYDTNGVQQWVSKVSQGINFVALDGGGNVFVAGGILAKLNNSSGSVVWTKTNTYGPFPVPVSGSNGLALDGSGNVYTASLYGGLFTTKFDTNGVQQWANSYANITTGVNGDCPTGNIIGVDSLGGVFVSGITPSSNTNVRNIVTIKYNTAGVQQWMNALPDAAYGSAVAALAVDNLGDAFVSGVIGDQVGGYGENYYWTVGYLL